MDSPLKETDLRNINKALYQLNELIGAIDKAKCAGVDCTEADMRREDLHAKLMSIKAAYFPGK